MRRVAALLGVVTVAGCSGSEERANGDLVANTEVGLYLIDPDGGTWRAIPGTRGGSEPEWSRDGSWIAFTRSRVVKSESWEAIIRGLHVVRPDGTEARLAVRNASASSWSPDGRQLPSPTTRMST
jgi:Tol biopolymer transport system component